MLFDVSRGSNEGEFPIVYYAHESSPPSVRQLTVTFPEFVAGIVGYPSEFNQRGHDVSDDNALFREFAPRASQSLRGAAKRIESRLECFDVRFAHGDAVADETGGFVVL